MNMNRKNLLVTLAILVLLVSCVAMLAGCNGDAVADIAISSTGKPRTIYVQGQELDLSQGSLTAMIDGNATSVPMSAEGVSVTGYNKDQLGKQTLTVSYQGKSTTYEITVVARMVVENHKANYFVGDVMDASMGRVKVANDKGVYENIELSSPELTFTGFQTTAAGTVTVTVTYGSYSASFDVTVYTPGEMSFTKPNKTIYQSHEKEPTLTGGYFTVTAAENAQFSDYVNITADMITGFDPAAATRDNRQNPLQQTLTVTYGGKTFQYDISILYSPVSVIYDSVELLKDLDWSQEEVTLTEEQGLAAQEAVTEYLRLSPADRELVDADMLEIFVRPAAQYLTGKMAEAAETFRDSFTVTETGSLLFVGKSSEQLRIDREKMLDENEPFNIYASLLRQMKKEFASMEMREDVLMEQYIVVTAEEEYLFTADAFDFLLMLHDMMKGIPDDWKVEDLAQYGDNIATAVYMIQANGFIGPNFSYVFDVLANWRTNNDYFDIIYSYYYYVEEGGKDFLCEHLWQKLPLPGKLQEWYLAFYNATVEAQYMENHADGGAYLWETSNFMYNYFKAVRLSEEIKNGDNAFYKEIYELIHGDAFMDQHITGAPGGFVYHSGGLLASEAYLQLWEQYLELIDLANSVGTTDEAYGQKAEEVFATMTALSPTELYGFLASLKHQYAETNGTFYALDYSDKANNTFVYLVANYHLGQLPETAHPLFQQMLIAMESYGIYQAGGKTEAMEKFCAAMEDMATKRDALSAEDLAAFDSLVGACYNKYLNAYHVEVDGKVPQVDESVLEKMEALKDTVAAYYELSVYMSENQLESARQQALTIVLISLYEKANALYTELSEDPNTDVQMLMYTKEYEMFEQPDTLSNGFFKMRTSFVGYLYNSWFEQKNENGQVVAAISVWAAYQSAPALSDFLLSAVDMLWCAFEEDVTGLEWEYVQGLMASLRQMDPQTVAVLYQLGPSYYFDSLRNFMLLNMGSDENTEKLVESVIMIEFGYMVYEFYEHAPREVEYFKTQFETARALVEQLEDTTLFDQYLREMYEHYEALYNSLA